MRIHYKFFVVLGLFLAFPFVHLFAQVSINTENSPPNSSAMLDVQSTIKGIVDTPNASVLLTAIASPVNGLMVYQTDGVIGVYYYYGQGPFHWRGYLLRALL